MHVVPVNYIWLMTLISENNELWRMSLAWKPVNYILNNEFWRVSPVWRPVNYIWLMTLISEIKDFWSVAQLSWNVNYFWINEFWRLLELCCAVIYFLLMAEITELQRQYDVMCPKTQVWSWKFCKKQSLVSKILLKTNFCLKNFAKNKVWSRNIL